MKTELNYDRWIGRWEGEGDAIPQVRSATQRSARITQSNSALQDSGADRLLHGVAEEIGPVAGTEVRSTSRQKTQAKRPG